MCLGTGQREEQRSAPRRAPSLTRPPGTPRAGTPEPGQGPWPLSSPSGAFCGSPAGARLQGVRCLRLQRLPGPDKSQALIAEQSQHPGCLLPAGLFLLLPGLPQGHKGPGAWHFEGSPRKGACADASLCSGSPPSRARQAAGGRWGGQAQRVATALWGGGGGEARDMELVRTAGVSSVPSGWPPSGHGHPEAP